MDRAYFVRGAIALLIVGLFTSCASLEEQAAERRQRLLALYPPGKTTRADVTNRWGGYPAKDSYQRPAAGWAAHELPGVAERCQTSERRTGKQVASCEGRLGPDGVFSLCYCWYFYDRRDRLVDVDWQWHSD